jgi:hypothetical protein
MEYFVGSVITLLTIFLVSKVIAKPSKDVFLKIPQMTQSRSHDLIKYLITNSFVKEEVRPKTQSFNHLLKNSIKVFFTEKEAYLIKDGKFLVGNVINNEIDMNSLKPVDIMGMSKVQLEKMIYIIDKLNGKESN